MAEVFVIFVLFQIPRAKSQGKKLFQGKFGVMHLIGCQNDFEGFRVAEFHHDLSAYAAGRGVFFQNAIFAAYDADGIEFQFPFADGLKKSGALRTV